MAPHENDRPLPLTKEMWASLIQCVRRALMIAQRRTPDVDECKQAQDAVEALEAIDSLTPERCLHCAIRDMIIAHAEAHGQDMLDTARAQGWNPSDPSHLSAQALILHARIVAIGTIAGELVAGHRPYSSSPLPDLITTAGDAFYRAFTDTVNEDVGLTGDVEPARPASPSMSEFVDGLRPPKSKLH